ncbi:unnamed protein product [Amoebophrya sp. A25]|nr:unnamed protein product [Amoebophrya sp. A25]|eukprot:GSA25T00015684001.1
MSFSVPHSMPHAHLSHGISDPIPKGAEVHTHVIESAAPDDPNAARFEDIAAQNFPVNFPPSSSLRSYATPSTSFEVIAQDGIMAIAETNQVLARFYGERAKKKNLVLQTPVIYVRQLPPSIDGAEPAVSPAQLVVNNIGSFVTVEVGIPHLKAQMQIGKTSSGDNTLVVSFDGFDDLSKGDLLSIKHRGYICIPVIFDYIESTKTPSTTAAAAPADAGRKSASDDVDELADEGWEVVKKLKKVQVEVFLHLDGRQAETQEEDKDVAWFKSELDRQVPRLKAKHGELVKVYNEQQARFRKQKAEADKLAQEQEAIKQQELQKSQERLMQEYQKHQEHLARVHAERQYAEQNGLQPPPRTSTSGLTPRGLALHRNVTVSGVVTPRKLSTADVSINLTPRGMSGSGSASSIVTAAPGTPRLYKASIEPLKIADIPSLDDRKPGPVVAAAHTPLANEIPPILDTPRIAPEEWHLKKDIVEHQLKTMTAQSDIEEEIHILKLRILRQIIFKEAHRIIGETHTEEEIHTFCGLFPRLWERLREARFDERPVKKRRGMLIAMQMNLMARGMSSGPAGQAELMYEPKKPKVLHVIKGSPKIRTRHAKSKVSSPRMIHEEQDATPAVSKSTGGGLNLNRVMSSGAPKHAHPHIHGASVVEFENMREGVNQVFLPTWMKQPKMLGIPHEALSPVEQADRVQEQRKAIIESVQERLKKQGNLHLLEHLKLFETPHGIAAHLQPPPSSAPPAGADRTAGLDVPNFSALGPAHMEPVHLQPHEMQHLMAHAELPDHMAEKLMSMGIKHPSAPPPPPKYEAPSHLQIGSGVQKQRISLNHEDVLPQPMGKNKPTLRGSIHLQSHAPKLVIDQRMLHIQDLKLAEAPNLRDLRAVRSFIPNTSMGVAAAAAASAAPASGATPAGTKATGVASKQAQYMQAPTSFDQTPRGAPQSDRGENGESVSGGSAVIPMPQLTVGGKLPGFGSAPRFSTSVNPLPPAGPWPGLNTGRQSQGGGAPAPQWTKLAAAPAPQIRDLTPGATPRMPFAFFREGSHRTSQATPCSEEEPVTFEDIALLHAAREHAHMLAASRGSGAQEQGAEVEEVDELAPVGIISSEEDQEEKGGLEIPLAGAASCSSASEPLPAGLLVTSTSPEGSDSSVRTMEQAVSEILAEAQERAVAVGDMEESAPPPAGVHEGCHQAVQEGATSSEEIIGVSADAVEVAETVIQTESEAAPETNASGSEAEPTNSRVLDVSFNNAATTTFVIENASEAVVQETVSASEQVAEKPIELPTTELKTLSAFIGDEDKGEVFGAVLDDADDLTPSEPEGAPAAVDSRTVRVDLETASSSSATGDAVSERQENKSELDQPNMRFYDDFDDDDGAGPHSATTAAVTFNSAAHLRIARVSPWGDKEKKHTIPHTIHKLKNTHSLLVHAPHELALPTDTPFEPPGPQEEMVRINTIRSRAGVQQGPYAHKKECSTPFEHSNLTVLGRNNYGGVNLNNLSHMQQEAPQTDSKEKDVKPHWLVKDNATSAIFDWDLRKLKLIEEILRTDPDVLTVQECDQYADFFRPFLAQLGYQSMFCPKSNAPGLARGFYADGVALFWKHREFVLKERYRGILPPGNACVMVILEYYEGDAVDAAMRRESEEQHHAGDAMDHVHQHSHTTMTITVKGQDGSERIEKVSVADDNDQPHRSHGSLRAASEDVRNDEDLQVMPSGSPLAATPRVQVSWQNSFSGAESPFRKSGSRTGLADSGSYYHDQSSSTVAGGNSSSAVRNTSSSDGFVDDEERAMVVSDMKQGNRRVTQFASGYLPPRRTHPKNPSKLAENKRQHLLHGHYGLVDVVGKVFAGAVNGNSSDAGSSANGASTPRLGLQFGNYTPNLPSAASLFSVTADQQGHLRHRISRVSTMLPGGCWIKDPDEVMNSTRNNDFRAPLQVNTPRDLSLPDFQEVFRQSLPPSHSKNAQPMDTGLAEKLHQSRLMNTPATTGVVINKGGRSAKSSKNPQGHQDLEQFHKKKYLLLATTHLKEGESASDVAARREQTAFFLDQIEAMKYSFSLEYGRKIDAVIVSGDLATNPYNNEVLPQMLAPVKEKSTVFQSAYKLPSSENEVGVFGGISRVQQERERNAKCPPTTVSASGKRSISDYILSSGLQLESRLWMPFMNETGEETTQLPSKGYPSDHFSLAAQYSFATVTVMKPVSKTSS